MARIRTIKPEFWTNEALSELPPEAHLLAAALLNYADDEGYFNANPKLVEASCKPLREDSVSVQECLDQLSKVGYIRIGKGEDGKRYGQIVKFSEHQRINRPTPSKINQLQINWEDSSTTHAHFNESSPPEQGTGNREQGTGKGTGNGEGKDLATGADAPPRNRKRRETKTGETWAAYAASYLHRYGTEPVRNASVNGKLSQFVDRVGQDDAPHIAAYFVSLNHRWYVTKGHAVGVMLTDAEKLATEWKTNRHVTDTEARQGDKRQAQAGVWQRLLDEERQKHGEH